MTRTDHDPARCPNCFAPSGAPSAAAPCPSCGWRPGLDNEAPYLPLGTQLNGIYRLGRVLGQGGFGVTYLAWDSNLHLPLAIKEYLPRDCATRAPDGQHLTIYSRQRDTFAYGLERFIDEARTLARFDQLIGVVGVKAYFKANASGYIVMDYVPGLTLKAYLERQGGRLPWEVAIRLLLPVIDALRVVHSAGLLHRDIAPDNIRITPQGQVRLLDFGAARQMAGQHSRSLSVILKPGYAPPEQYRSRGKQGPWTDVYALAATLYRCLTGQTPPEALDRVDNDDLRWPTELGIPIPAALEASLRRGLELPVESRTQNMEILRDELLAVLQAQRPAPDTSLPPAPEPPAPVNPPRSPPWWLIGLGATALGALASAVVWALLHGVAPPPSGQPIQAAEAQRRAEALAAQQAAAERQAREAAQRSPRLIANRYQDHGDGTVTDTQTGLQWMRCSQGQRWTGTDCDGEAERMTWNAAMPNGRQKTWPRFAGYSDWRLPTAQELHSLVYCSSGQQQPLDFDAQGAPRFSTDRWGRCLGDYQRPTIDQTAFPGTPSRWFWSASPNANGSYSAWYVGFGNGHVSDRHKSDGNAVRLVRGGQ